MEEILRKIPGVVGTKVGYAGGRVDTPSYEAVSAGGTGHAESVEVVFDPAQLSYERLLDYFFRMHDPTTVDRQHNDVGSQYRSAIYFTNESQQRTATRVKSDFDASSRFKNLIVTEITPATKFYAAEDYHQKYLVKNPHGYNSHVLVD